MKSPDLAFAARFKEACENNPKLPKPQNALGKVLGVSGPMVSNYRKGEKLPSMPTAIDISIACGVCVEWLLTGRGAKYPGDEVSLSVQLQDKTVDEIYELLGSDRVLGLFDKMKAALAESIASKNS